MLRSENFLEEFIENSESTLFREWQLKLLKRKEFIEDSESTPFREWQLKLLKRKEFIEDSESTPFAKWLLKLLKRRRKTQIRFLKELQGLDKAVKDGEKIQQIFQKIKQSSVLPPPLKKIYRSLIVFSVVLRLLLKNKEIGFEPDFFEKAGKLIGISGSTVARHLYDDLSIKKGDLIKAIKMAHDRAPECSQLIASRVAQCSYALGIPKKDLIEGTKKAYDRASECSQSFASCTLK